MTLIPNRYPAPMLDMLRPPGPRSTISHTFEGPRIEIPAQRSWFLIVFLSIWLCGWFLGEAFALGSVLSWIFGWQLGGEAFSVEDFAGAGGAGPGLFILLWLVGWTLGGGFALYTWLWNLAGKEIVTLDSQALTHRRQIARLGLTRRYDVTHIKDLRVAPPQRSRRGAHGTPFGGTIAFDYGSRTVRFGQGIDEPEAKDLVELLKRHLPHSLSDSFQR